MKIVPSAATTNKEQVYYKKCTCLFYLSLYAERNFAKGINKIKSKPVFYGIIDQ